MRAREMRDASRLAGFVVNGLTRRIHETHSGIADRVFGAIGPVATPARAAHDAITHVTYGTVGTALRAGVMAGGFAAAPYAGGRRLDESKWARVALAVVNGAHGDLIQQRAPALALEMTVRVAGRDVALVAPSLRDAFPKATGRIAVFLHGLTETEGAWCFQAQRHHGRREITYGALLQRDLGFTPVFIRYNTGLHISDNGRRLHEVLVALVDAWPTDVQELVLIGHSMGGLVARSALHRAGSGTDVAAPWTRLVSTTITLGTPHLGAPLERAAHRMTHALARIPEARAVSRVLALRSAGIKDLRHGTLVEEDWFGRDLDAPDRPVCTRIPLHDGARHYVVMATLTRGVEARSAQVLGDLLVPPLSAMGDSGDDERLAFPVDHIHHLPRRHHFHLLNDPTVYRRIREWLEQPG